MKRQSSDATEAQIVTTLRAEMSGYGVPGPHSMSRRAVASELLTVVVILGPQVGEYGASKLKLQPYSCWDSIWCFIPSVHHTTQPRLKKRAPKVCPVQRYEGLVLAKQHHLHVGCTSRYLRYGKKRWPGGAARLHGCREPRIWDLPQITSLCVSRSKKCGNPNQRALHERSQLVHDTQWDF